MQNIIRAVIFDLDGVIVNSNPEIEKFWQQWAAKENVALNETLIREHIHGRKGIETIENLFYKSSEEVKNKMIEEAGIFDTNMQPKAIDGVIDFIKKLNALKMRTGLVTSSHKPRMLKMLNLHGLTPYFNAFVSAEDVTKGKPSPDPYIKMNQKLGVEPNGCLVFEDAISGVQSANSAGMKVIGIANEFYKAQLMLAGAIDVIKNFNEINVSGSLLTTVNNIHFTLVHT